MPRRTEGVNRGLEADGGAGQVHPMTNNRPPLLDMTPDGSFRAPAGPAWTTRVIGLAVLVAVIGGAVAFAAFALWIALLLIPVVALAVLVAIGMFRFKVWQARRRMASGRSVRPL